MNQEDFRLSTPPLDDLLPEVIRQLGYPSARLVSRDIQVEVERQIRRARELVEPAFLWKQSAVESWGPGGIVGRDLVIRSAKWAGLADRLGQPVVIFSFVVTLGKRLDEAIASLQRESLLQGYLLDATGSVLAEEMAGQADRFASGFLAGEGYQTTLRFSPGYCDWEVGDGQRELFRFLMPEDVGVGLSAGGMMIPRKSVSACIIGAREVPLKAPCGLCTQTACPYRRYARPAPSGKARLGARGR